MAVLYFKMRDEYGITEFTAASGSKYGLTSYENERELRIAMAGYFRAGLKNWHMLEDMELHLEKIEAVGFRTPLIDGAL
jgi:hypothetical protein